MRTPVFSKAQIRFSDGGKTLSESFTSKTTVGPVDVDFSEDASGLKLVLHASREVRLESVTVEMQYEFSETDRMFNNGYQSWTDSFERGIHDKMHNIDHVSKNSALNKRYGFTQYGDYNFVRYGKKRGQFHGFTYAYIRHNKTYLLYGSLAENTGYTIIRFDAPGKRVKFEKDCKGRLVSGDYTVFDVGIYLGPEDQVFDDYFAALHVKKPAARRVTGYTSWYNLYENISEQSVTDDLEGFSGFSKKPEYFQVDDGYEQAVGDWLTVDPGKFPHGMKYVADRIREAGMIPGLWLAPFAAENDSELLKKHPDWLLKDQTGQPVYAGGNWSGFYALDIYNEDFRQYLREVFDTVVNQWGYKLLKLDFLYAACIEPRKHKTRGEVMYDAAKFLRELCGSAEMLACGAPLAPFFGVADFCRIGCDVSLNWDGDAYMKLFHRERVSTKFSLLNTLFRRQLNGRAFLNDPDVYLLRDDNIQMLKKRKEQLLTVNALFGGVLFTSDNVGNYDFHKRRALDRAEALTPFSDQDGAISVEKDRENVTVMSKDVTLIIPLKESGRDNVDRKETLNMATENRFIVVHTEGSAMAEGKRTVLVDRETGVNYLQVESGGISVTPLIDADGKPIVTKL